MRSYPLHYLSAPAPSDHVRLMRPGIEGFVDSCFPGMVCSGSETRYCFLQSVGKRNPRLWTALSVFNQFYNCAISVISTLDYNKVPRGSLKDKVQTVSMSGYPILSHTVDNTICIKLPRVPFLSQGGLTCAAVTCLDRLEQFEAYM